MFRAQRPRTAELTPRPGDGPVNGVALLLPGGFIRSRSGPLKVAERGLRDLSVELTDRGRPHNIAVHLLRYRYAGTARTPTPPSTPAGRSTNSPAGTKAHRWS